MGCIYKVSIKETGGFYIGSTKNVIHRKSDHKIMLLNNKHHCKKLQDDFNCYGIDSFLFEIISDNIPNEHLVNLEFSFIQMEMIRNSDKCYNTLSSYNLPESVKESISDGLKEYYKNNKSARIGRKHTEETKEKIRVNRTPTSGENHYRYGKTLSEEVRKKIGDTQRGVKKAPRVVSPEGKEKIRKAAEAGHYSHWIGRKHTEESKQKMSKRVKEVTSGNEFNSLTETLEFYNLKMPTLNRALKSGKPLSKGPNKGLQFEYL